MNPYNNSPDNRPSEDVSVNRQQTDGSAHSPREGYMTENQHGHPPGWLSIEYWLGQLFVIGATVLGVYLAASVGFDQAVDFEVFTEYMDEYDVTSSLYEEAQANVAYVIAQANKRLAEPSNAKMKLPELKLKQFIWTTMQYNTQTFELSSDVLNGTQQYYADIEYHYAKINTGWKEDTTAAANKLIEVTQVYQAQVLSKLEARIEQLNTKLAEYDPELVSD